MKESIQNQLPEQVIRTALDTLDIVVEHNTDAETEAQQLLKNPGHDDPLLQDLTQWPFVTIDNPDSRDLDQALHIEKTPQGYRLRYALADAAYYIRPGTALFTEALKRGASYYTPLFAAPMLPTSLSEGLVSLNPDVQRRALVFDIQLDDHAAVQQTSIVRALIRSRAKLSYGGVQAWLDTHCQYALSDSERAVMNCDDNDTQSPSPSLDELDKIEADGDYQQSLALLQELGEKLISVSAQRGVVPFDRSETSIQMDTSGNRFTASRRHRYMTEQYNEQISLLCNMQGAELLMALQGHSDAMQAVYRVHEAPLSKNSKSLRKTLVEIADTQNLDKRWRWEDDMTLSQYVRNLPDGPTDKRLKATIQRQIMRAQRASVFQPEPDIHHALKAAAYARFSSPMREIVGIFTHKELLEALNMESASDKIDDQLLRERVIEAANQARQKQRQLDKKIEFAVIQNILGNDLAAEQQKVYSATINLSLRS